MILELQITERLKLPDGTIVGDPFMDSGSCGVAVKELRAEGRDIGYVGCEIVEEYFQIASGKIQ